MDKMFALAEVKAVEDADGDPNGEFDVILSTPTLDRDGEVVDSKIFEPLPEHITFDIDHGMSTATTVGSGVPRYDEQGRLRVKGTYSSIPRAQEVRTLVREGHIRTTSVAFMGARREQKDGVTHVVQAQLLNGAFVPIPANPDALVLSSKAYNEKVSGSPTVAPVVRKAHGMTANELREALEGVLREAYGTDDSYTWIRDYADDWVVFERNSSDEYATYRQGYTATDGVIALDGAAVEVAPHVTYTPKSSPTPAPEPPVSTETGKAPASTVVEYARLRAQAALLSP